MVSVDEERRRLRLSFAPKTAADAAAAAGADPMGGLQPGAIVEGRVHSITTKEVRSILGKSCLFKGGLLSMYMRCNHTLNLQPILRYHRPQIKDQIS